MDFNFDTGTIFDGIQTIDPTVLPPLGGQAGVLTIAGQGAVLMPNGPSGSRPSPAASGMLRFNSNLTDMEYFDGTTWVQLSTGGGTVTSVAVTTGTGLTVSGGNSQTITNSGTFALDLNSALTGLSTISSTGIITSTAPGVFTSRTIQGTVNNINVTNGDGILGNPTINLATVTQGAIGSFLKFGYDSFGRITSNTPVTQTDITTLVDAVYVNVTGDSMSGDLTFTSGATATGIPTPVNGSDAAPKNYVDAAIQGLSFKQTVKAATTIAAGNITIAGFPIIDGYQTVAGDRILVKNQVDQTANGIYIAASGTWARSADANTGALLEGAYVFVDNGTINADTSWAQITPAPITIGTTPIVWSQFSGAGTYTAGTGLSLTGTQFSLITPVSTTNGGTGTNSAPTAGEILVGTSSGTFNPTLIVSGNGINVLNGDGTITVANTGVLSLTGTTNQINVSASTGNITLSLPAGGITTSNLTLTGVNPNAFLYSGTGGLLSTIVATDGQILVGSTGGAPVATTITAGTGVSVTNGAGSITIANTGVTSVDVSGGLTGLSFSGGPVTTTGTILMSGTLNPTHGGSGLTSLGTANQVLGVNASGSAAEYKTISASTGISITNTPNDISIMNTGVTSVAFQDASATPIYTVTGSPVTTTGTLTVTLASQVANTAFLAPNGTAGQPGFRAIAYADLPLQLYVENPSTPTAPIATGVNAVAIGSGSHATGTGSLAEGNGSLASNWGSAAFANGSFSSAGDAQHGTYILRNITTDATVTELFLDGVGGSESVVIPFNSVVTFNIMVAGRRTDATGGGAGYKFEGAIRMDGTAASITFIGSPSKTILGETNSPWDANVIADTSTGTIRVTVTGQAAKTIRWVATMLTTEVTN
jgi:hypothetical protein